MKEYIVPVNNTDRNDDEIFVGFIRKRKELIRCKDCVKYKNIGVAGYGYCPWIEQRVEEDFFCADGCAAERKEK